MEKYDHRRERLRELVRRFYDGKASRLAAAIERQADYVSRCLSTKNYRKRIGEDFAAHVTTTLGLPPNFFDQPLGTFPKGTTTGTGAPVPRLTEPSQQYRIERQRLLDDFDALPDGMQTYAADWMARLRTLCDSFTPVVRQIFEPPKDPAKYVDWERNLVADMLRLRSSPGDDAGEHGETEAAYERKDKPG